MDLNRRLFLEKFAKTGAVCAATGLMLPKDVLAENYSLTNKASSKYIYDPRSSQVVGGGGYADGEIDIQSMGADWVPTEKRYGDSFWDAPRKVFLQRKKSKGSKSSDKVAVEYYKNGGIHTPGYETACHLLRDVEQNEAVMVDLKLLDLICATQAWLKFYGYGGPIIVTSGYRSKRTNSNIEGAAKNSMHLHAKAIDFTIPGFSPVDLARIATKFKAGGVGIYSARNFVHLDTGRVRTWRG